MILGNQVRALPRGHTSFWTAPRRLHTTHVKSTQRPITLAVSARADTTPIRSTRHQPDLLPAGTARIALPAIYNRFS
jgi:hypothetical protein